MKPLEAFYYMKKTPTFATVKEFENKIAEFFGARYAVATDSCTHGLELCLRYANSKEIYSPKRTYLSIPMLASKLGIKLRWENNNWHEYYRVSEVSYPDGLATLILDAATVWERNAYIANTFMCLSFQYQKHLSVGRGGMILLDDLQAAEALKKMSYDGRLPGIPWRDQNVDTMGYHYYMTPETAEQGLQKLDDAISKKPRLWSYEDYPDLTEMEVFKK